MKILMIGKYPPMQGGISTKTYWLYKEIEKDGVEFWIITLDNSHYSTNEHNSAKVTVVKDKQVPWHIPETSLVDDRLLNAALKATNDFTPDLIETNYLWPFCKDALFIAQTLNKPLLIRHAGSDILKFYNDQEFRDIMSIYFDQAAAIVSNISSIDLLKDICNDTGKIRCMPRYIPNPDIFKSEKPDKQYDILFAGKINYNWHLKGLKLLLELIKQKELKALFLIGGKYKDDIYKQITEKKLESRIKLNGFVKPDKMPAIYNACKFVWCWEEEGVIEDFSNIIWEALFCNTPCLINSNVSKKMKNEGITGDFSNLLHAADAKSVMELDFSEKNSSYIDNQRLKSDLFSKYVKSNADLYMQLVS